MRRLQPLLCLLALLVPSISALDRNSTSDLHTRGRRVPACGPKDGHQGNHHVIDLSEPENPGPFHDLTTAELKKLRAFLEKDPSIKAGDPKSPSPNSSYIFAADLLVPDKSGILNYLDKKEGLKPERKARVVLFRGDKTPAVVEELVCGPLPEVQRCELLKLNSRRNPIEYSFRPYSDNDVNGVVRLMEAIEKKAGHILMESYGAKFLGCKKAEDCLTLTGSPVGSELTKQPEKRMSWLAAAYNLPYKSVHILDLTLLVETSSSDKTQWSLVKLWYGNKLFSSLDELVDSYNNGKVNKTKATKPVNDHNLFSSLQQKGDPLPTHPQRPPTLVEPDGKRYSVQGKQVKYLGWSFNFRLSSLTGPAVYDVKYQGQRVAYEVALSEIGVFYSGYGPLGQTSNYVDSSLLLGSWSRALVPGGDCPDTATLVSTPFMSQTKGEPDVHPASICLFEQNNGYPLRRHLAYDYQSGSFYGGLLDSVLIMRSALTIDNYDYLVDVIFHQNGVIEGRIMSTALDRVAPPALSEHVTLICQWIIFGIVCQAIDIFGLITNTLNIICFAQQGFKDPFNISLLGLAVADLGCLGTLVWTNLCYTPAFMTLALPFDTIEFQYLTSGMPHTTFTRVSGWITAIITLERCLCVTLPLKVKTIVTPRRVSILIIAMFTLLLSSVAPLYMVNGLGPKFFPRRNKTLLGLIHTVNRENVEQVNFGINNIFIPFSAFAVISICTVILVVKMQRHTRWQKETINSAQVGSISSRNRRASKMVLMISTLFIVCFVPISVLFTAVVLEPELSIDGKFKHILIVTGGIGFILESINSSVNIFIYYHVSSKYRFYFRRMFGLRQNTRVRIEDL